MKKLILFFAFALFAGGAHAYKIADSAKTTDGKIVGGKTAIVVDSKGKLISGGATQQASVSGPTATAAQSTNAAKPTAGGAAPEAKATATEKAAQEDFAKKSKDIQDKLKSIRNNQNNQNKDKDKNKK
ncbi:MAG: hypothetical protein LBG16_02015 [Elusimicrobiota bacterium]|jgi:hypothetical protein|nr:hypothetical protein [Elusimicrobiota bacterium]